MYNLYKNYTTIAIAAYKDIVKVFHHFQHIQLSGSDFKKLKIAEAIEEAQILIEACK